MLCHFRANLQMFRALEIHILTISISNFFFHDIRKQSSGCFFSNSSMITIHFMNPQLICIMSDVIWHKPVKRETFTSFSLEIFFEPPDMITNSAWITTFISCDTKLYKPTHPSWLSENVRYFKKTYKVLPNTQIIFHICLL